MRYPKSYIYRVAMYAHHVCGMHTFTSRDLWELGECAFEWYNSMLPFNPETEKDRILAKHGWTKEDWHRVMASSRSFYFVPDAATTAVNDEIRALFKPHPHLVSVACYTNYVRELVSHAIKRGYFEYVDRSPKYFTYRINPQYLDDPSFPRRSAR